MSCSCYFIIFRICNGVFSEFLVFYIDNELKRRKDEKVILFMAGILASMMLNAQSRWSVTPEAGLVVNKEMKGHQLH